MLFIIITHRGRSELGLESCSHSSHRCRQPSALRPAHLRTAGKALRGEPGPEGAEDGAAVRTARWTTGQPSERTRRGRHRLFLKQRRSPPPRTRLAVTHTNNNKRSQSTSQLRILELVRPALLMDRLSSGVFPDSEWLPSSASPALCSERD